MEAQRAPSEAARPLPSGATQGEEDMRDEYGDMDDDLGETCVVDKFELDSGHTMSKVGGSPLAWLLRSRPR